ncbi:hypothetical protein KI126_002542 [Enterococcus faecium]|nr:hypothetical protein [Enterococcus faecalis]EME8274638.1 hypothetical protein [Enterococcus faecium]EMF0280474.1 hypothetical protein [Enterococcus faecium]
MGLVFSPSESQGLVGALRVNIATAETMIEQLNQASKRLIDALNGHTLSGAAYTAGKGLFLEMVLPTISKASESLQQLKSKLNQYESYAGAAGGEFLDEDKLNQQLELLRAQQASLTSQINYYRMMSISCPENASLNMMYSNFQNQLSNYLSTTAEDIQKVQDKLKRLHELNMKTELLFKGIVSEFSNLSRVISVIGNTSFDNSGKAIFKSISAKELVGMLTDLGSSITDPKEWLNESSSKFIDEMRDTIIKEGKNIGRSWAARLQPRSSLGTFVKDEIGPRRWLTRKLKGISNPASQAIGNVAKWGSRGLFALGAYTNFEEYNVEYHNTGRAIVYSGVSTLASWAAGGAGVAIGTTVGTAVTSGLISAGAIASGGLLASGIAIAAPVAGAVVVGAAVGVAVKAAYEHIKPIKDTVDFLGDKINDIGKAFSSPLKSFKGVFRW